MSVTVTTQGSEIEALEEQFSVSKSDDIPVNEASNTDNSNSACSNACAWGRIFLTFHKSQFKTEYSNSGFSCVYVGGL